MKERPVARHDLPATEFPFVIEAFHPVTKRVVWSTIVELPPQGEQVKVEIPPLSERLGHPVAIRVIHSNGSMSECEPGGKPRQLD